jgi:hypothetical protein
MKPCWKNVGLTEPGAALADEFLPQVLALIEKNHAGGPDTLRVLECVLREVAFRTYVLPTRTPDFQEKYLKENS